MKVALPLVLAFAASSMLAQTAPAKRTAPRRTATSSAATAAASASGEANAPGIPKVTAAPKTLYSLRYVELVVGTGELAAPRKWYTVHYTGWLTDGTKFDSSVDRGQPFTFPYGARRVIAGWDTGFEGMHVGGKRRLIVPYQLAYGEVANEKIPAKSTLIFDVELLGMSDTPPAPPAAPKPATPPADAAPKPSEPSAPASAPAPQSAPAPRSAPAPSTPAPATAPGNPGHPDPAKLPGAPPSGL